MTHKRVGNSPGMMWWILDFCSTCGALQTTYTAYSKVAPNPRCWCCGCDLTERCTRIQGNFSGSEGDRLLELTREWQLHHDYKLPKSTQRRWITATPFGEKNLLRNSTLKSMNLGRRVFWSKDEG